MKNFVNKQKGFSLVETLVGVAIFLIITVAVYSGYVQILRGVQILKVKNTAASLANELIEVVRNLPYDDVGIVNGLPPGKIPRNQTINRNNIDFDVEVSIRSIDDPFDGLIGEDPNDLSPADYKLVQYDLVCSDCPYPENLTFYTRVSPENLETMGNNGALFIQVFDSSGQPISGAEVSVENYQGTSTIDIDETTNNDGVFQIVDAPPGVEAYEILVTKDGYSTEQTYTVGDAANPAPNLPHANVVSGEVTQVSFSIDKLSDLFVETKTSTCTAVPYVDMNIRGSKTIGYQTYKYNEDLSTNGSGDLDLEDMEWDNYTFTITDSGYQLSGSSELFPVDLVPDTEKHLDLIMTPSDPNGLLVQVRDAETGLPLSDAVVTISNGGDSETLMTSRGFIKQTDWSVGSGQDNIGSLDRYYTGDGNIDTTTSPGDLQLVSVAGSYVGSGYLISSTFDMGTTTNFHLLNWEPFDQPLETGDSSVRFQVATNLEVTATSTWDFVGPDGTGSSYYTSPSQTISDVHDGDRYLRYKVYLQTADSGFTPLVSEVTATFASECAPPGQVFFSGLNAGEYSLEVTLDNYQDFYTENFLIADDWHIFEVTLNPDN